jgi:hypothetical protein
VGAESGSSPFDENPELHDLVIVGQSDLTGCSTRMLKKSHANRQGTLLSVPGPEPKIKLLKAKLPSCGTLKSVP